MATKTARKYKLMNAPHIMRNPNFDPEKPSSMEDNPKSITLQPGAIIEGVDLDTKFVNKFILVDQAIPLTPAVAGVARKSPAPTDKPEGERDLDKEYGNLDEMTVEDIREVAASEEIDISGLRIKAEILSKIRGK